MATILATDVFVLAIPIQKKGQTVRVYSYIAYNGRLFYFKADFDKAWNKFEDRHGSDPGSALDPEYYSHEILSSEDLFLLLL